MPRRQWPRPLNIERRRKILDFLVERIPFAGGARGRHLLGLCGWVVLAWYPSTITVVL